MTVSSKNIAYITCSTALLDKMNSIANDEIVNGKMLKL